MFKVGDEVVIIETESSVLPFELRGKTATITNAGAARCEIEVNNYGEWKTTTWYASYKSIRKLTKLEKVLK